MFMFELKLKSEHVYLDLMFSKKLKINGVPWNDIVTIFQDSTVSYSIRDLRVFWVCIPIFESVSAKDYNSLCVGKQNQT